MVANILALKHSFVFLQETFHLPSSKNIHKTEGNYHVFHHSDIDENNRTTKLKGGLITYVSTDITNTTTVYRSCPNYIILITGKLVTINTYLPQQGLYQDGVYKQRLSEIKESIMTLGPTYAYLLAGDFNSHGHNKRAFRKFIEQEEPDDWSKDITYTYSQPTRKKSATGQSGGLCATKLDHILTFNFPQDSCKACFTDTHIVSKGAHLPVCAEASMPHLDIDEGFVDDDDIDAEDPLAHIDYRQCTDEHDKTFREAANDIFKRFESDHRIQTDPVEALTAIYKELSDTALCVFPQEKYNPRFKRQPGWNKYVRDAQREYEVAEMLWHYAGCNPHGTLAENLNKARLSRKHALDKMKEKIRESIAEMMADDFSDATHIDRSKCWKPVRATIKGNATACSPIIEGHRKTSEIVNYWRTYYMDKLAATEGPLPTSDDSLEFLKVTAMESDSVEIDTESTINAIHAMNMDCAYYDMAGPKMLAKVNTGFSELFSKCLTNFLNSDLEDQKFFLRSPNNFLISYIKPIPKAADMNATLAKSYRPISVSHTLTILLERTFMIGKYFHTKSPYNFYGYIRGRSCDIAVDTLKRIVAAEKANIRSVVLVTLDASGAFEGVDWDKIFPRLVKGNNPKIIRCIWLLYRYNRYEVRWKTQRASMLFCATKGTKQGGVLSGYIFCAYMDILNEKLLEKPGIHVLGAIWNALFYADDVLLIARNHAHAQILLNCCEWFQKEGFIRWNASKTKVVYLTDDRRIVNVPTESDLRLDGKNLERKICIRWLGYLLNHRLTDDDMIRRQACRLYALTNNIKTEIPLDLLEDDMLRKMTYAYGGIYMLPVLTSSTQAVFKELKTAHRYLVAELTQYYQRSPEHWDPLNGKYERGNRYMYGRLKIRAVDTMLSNQIFRFQRRFYCYVHKFSPYAAELIRTEFNSIREGKKQELIKTMTS